MYVEYRIPQTPRHSTPVVMMHGLVHTGASYISTPDGRLGWAPYFARQGWPTYVVDWPGSGRSPMPPDFLRMTSQPVIDATIRLLERLGPSVLLVHSASGPMGYKIADTVPHLVRAVIAVAPGPPANLSPVLGRDHPRYNPEDELVRISYEYALANWGNSDRFPHEAFDAYYAGLGPASPVLRNERWNIDGRGVYVRGPETFANIPLLIVTGDQDPVHPRHIDQEIADYFGGEFLWLADVGLSGHGHLMMIEHGNLAIADLLIAWLMRHGL